MKVTPFIASRFRSDGGTNFGIVPKALWERLIRPDDRNRIAQNLNALLIELDDGRTGIIDTGCGDPAWYSEKERAIHGLEESWSLARALDQLEVDRSEINFVVLTHSHWDHVSGVGHSTGGDVTLTFPNAVHYLHAIEWGLATSGDPLLSKAYPAASIEPLRALPDDQLELVDDDRCDVLPGISMILTGGHTAGHCCLLLEAPDGVIFNHPDADPSERFQRLLYAGDVCTMPHHLRLVYQTAFDSRPLDTRRWKLEWLPRVAADGTVLLFIHDPDLAGATIRPDDKREFVVDRAFPCIGSHPADINPRAAGAQTRH